MSVFLVAIAWGFTAISVWAGLDEHGGARALWFAFAGAFCALSVVIIAVELRDRSRRGA